MEAFGFLLTTPRARRRRRDLIQFVEGVRLFLRVGWDLAYAWPRTFEQLKDDFGDEARELLAIEPSEGFLSALRAGAAKFPEPAHRTWWALIADLHEAGASLGDALGAFSQTLKEEHRRDLEQHVRAAPTVTNLCLLLFFLPPTVVLILLPLIVGLIGER